MSQKSREQLRRFEQKMRNEGADGFADGPRPWEHWDESGNQESNRIWEGSATRINGKHNKHGPGHRLLSFLAFIALATLLVGIGGVYYTHTQHVAQTGGHSLPNTDQTGPVSASPDSEAAVVATTEANKLDILTASAAGTSETQDQGEAAVDSTATEEPEVATAVTQATSDSIDSVAIETVVTEQSITTTVYTRHPQQDKPEIIAAIETTPPPFAHEVASEQQTIPEPQPTEDVADEETITEPVSAPPSPAEQIDEAATVAAREQNSEATTTEPVAESAAIPIEEQPSESVEPVTAVAKTGNWVINLASYTWKSTANRKLALFEQQGVDAEVFEVMINDKPMYRIRVVGFESSRAAKAEIPALEQTLGLKGAWISKR